MIIKRENKKAGHVGMILSFVIFVTFLIFIYSITEPVARVERGKEDLLDYLQTELIENVLVEDMTTATFNIRDHISGDCVKVRMITGTEEWEAVVRGESNVLSSSKESPYILLDRAGENFVKVHYSREFEDGGGFCFGPETLNEGADYDLGLVRTESYIFESKIQEMITNFESNYTEIKNDLNLAPGNEFGLSFKNAEDIIINTEEKNISVNVYVEEIPIQYIDSEANIKPGFLSIKVW